MEQILTPLSESVHMIIFNKKTEDDKQPFMVVYKNNPTKYIFLITTESFDDFVSWVRSENGKCLNRTIHQLIERKIVFRINLF